MVVCSVRRGWVGALVRGVLGGDRGGGDRVIGGFVAFEGIGLLCCCDCLMGPADICLARDRVTLGDSFGGAL